MESDDLDVRDADTIRKECDKHEWQDHLITKLVRRNTSNLIHRMASRLRHVDKADFDYVLPEVIHKKSRRRLQSIITGTMINTRIMKNVNEEAKSPNPVDRILLSPLSSNRKQHSFLDMIDRRRDKQMVGENIETKKSDASQEAMYAAIQLESLTKDKVSSSRGVESLVLYSVRCVSPVSLSFFLERTHTHTHTHLHNRYIARVLIL